jgi:ferritin-like metal-binding protein YciE
MIEKATNRELATGLRDHLRETENQIIRLDGVLGRKWGSSLRARDWAVS